MIILHSIGSQVLLWFYTKSPEKVFWNIPFSDSTLRDFDSRGPECSRNLHFVKPCLWLQWPLENVIVCLPWSIYGTFPLYYQVINSITPNYWKFFSKFTVLLCFFPLMNLLTPFLPALDFLLFLSKSFMNV